MRTSRPSPNPLLALVALTSAVAHAGSQPPTTSSTRPADADVASLVHALGADEEADRAAAQRQLVDLGSTADDALGRAADGDPDPEVRSRAAAALAEIRDRAETGPTLVTVHAHDGDPAAVLADIGEQAHADLVAPPPAPRGGRPSPRVTLDADRRPFWDVMGDVCGQLDLCPRLDAPAAHATIDLYQPPRNWMRSAPHQVVGPYWVAVAGLYRLSSVELDGPPATDDRFLARLIVFPEPKLVVTAVSPLAVRVADDDAGHSLVPPAGAASARPAARSPARLVEARLRYPLDATPGRRITTLAGDLTVTLAQASHRFEVDDVLGHPTVTRPLPGVTVRVGVTRDGGTYLVTVECARDGLPDQQWTAMTNRVGDLSLKDAAGHALPPAGGWTIDSGNTDRRFKATGPFAAAAEPRRVVWTVADRFKVVTVPVAFHDLPMP